MFFEIFIYRTQFNLLVIIRQLEEEAKARDDGATMTTILCAAFAPLTLGLSMIGQLSANAQRAQADFCRKDLHFLSRKSHVFQTSPYRTC